VTITLGNLKRKWMKEPGFKEGYDALAPEFEVASLLIEARTRAKLSQAFSQRTHIRRVARGFLREVRGRRRPLVLGRGRASVRAQDQTREARWLACRRRARWQ
jgi:hypothetical protein